MDSSYKAALYIHIPFCSRKCDYCDFFSITDYSYCLDTIEQICRQIEEDKKRYGISGFLSVYLGGGTPGSLPPELMTSLFSTITRVNGGSLPPEVTLECNPENVTPEALVLWMSCGINRISLGVQSFQDEFLIRAGRNSSRKKILRALKLLKKESSLTLNLDLIQGLPGMTAEDQLADLVDAVSFDPEHLSWYSLTLEQGTVLDTEWDTRQNRDLSPEMEEQIWVEGCLLLFRKGYSRYEVSNFARPGRECLHNKAYWKMNPYLGCGPGAVSMILNEHGQLQRHRIAKDVSSFAAGKIIRDQIEQPDPVEFLKDYLLMGLRLRDGISLKEFGKIFGHPPEAFFFRTLSSHSSLIMQDKGFLKTTKEGLDVLNPLLIDLFEEIDTQTSFIPLQWPLRGDVHP